MAHLGTPVLLPHPDYRGDFRTSQHEQAMRKLDEADQMSRRLGEVIGRLLRFPIADGYAVYRVEKLRPLTLAHVDYADGYSIPAAHLRGLTLTDVKTHLRQRDVWDWRPSV